MDETKHMRFSLKMCPPFDRLFLIAFLRMRFRLTLAAGHPNLIRRLKATYTEILKYWEW